MLLDGATHRYGRVLVLCSARHAEHPRQVGHGENFAGQLPDSGAASNRLASGVDGILSGDRARKSTVGYSPPTRPGHVQCDGRRV